MKSKAETENDEGMLEYLEDIIGSSRLKQPIEQLASDVEELNDLRREKVWFYLLDLSAMLSLNYRAIK